MDELLITNNQIYAKSVKSIASGMDVSQGAILVTGATGLIGSCLIDVLVAANTFYGKKFEIYAMGRSEERLRQRFSNNEQINYIIQDVIEPIHIKKLDYIIHAASNADPRSYATQPVETILTNILGAKNILDYSKNNKTRSLLTSTFEVYGKLDQDEYSEEDYGVVDINFLRSSYPESKRTAELLFRGYNDEYGTNTLIARLSSIYGPTMKPDDSKAHAQFLRNAIAGEDIVLKSEGTQKRTYCYVIDAVSALLEVLFKGKAGEAYNVANDKSIVTIAELAKIVASLAGTKVVFDMPDDIEKKGFSRPQNCILKTDKLAALGWKGKYTIEQGLKETLSILKELYEA